MYKTLIVVSALVASSMATIELLATTTNAAGATVGTTTLLSTTAATGLFVGVGIVKAIGLGLLLREAAGRNKRDVGGVALSTDASFNIVEQLEPAQCIRRLICDISTGKLATDEVDEVLTAALQVRTQLCLCVTCLKAISLCFSISNH